MRYSSLKQEEYAERGRVKVYRIAEASGYVHYIVNSPEGGIPSIRTKSLAVDKAKQLAEELRYAFNPRLDYLEVYNT